MKILRASGNIARNSSRAVISIAQHHLTRNGKLCRYSWMARDTEIFALFVANCIKMPVSNVGKLLSLASICIENVHSRWKCASVVRASKGSQLKRRSNSVPFLPIVLAASFRWRVYSARVIFRETSVKRQEGRRRRDGKERAKVDWNPSLNLCRVIYTI